MKIKILILVIIVSLVGGIFYLKSLYLGENKLGALVEFSVDSGQNFSQVTSNLKANNLISNEFLFKVLARVQKVDNKIHAGVFNLNQGMGYKQILDNLIEGRQSTYKLLVKEGESLYDIAQSLQELGVVKTQDEFFKVVGYPASDFEPELNSISSKFEFTGYVGKVNSWEGFLFPDTYVLLKNDSVQRVTELMLSNFNNKILQLYLDSNTKLSLDEVITLASIVAKEGKTFEDKRMVAGVFLNRINIGMAIQSDATVNYITRKVTDNPSLEDITNTSPYNTYKNVGLPPGPISNPGLDDIKAVLDPSVHKYYYFLNTQDLQIIYSKTFDEHVANRRKYNQ